MMTTKDKLSSALRIVRTFGPISRRDAAVLLDMNAARLLECFMALHASKQIWRYGGGYVASLDTLFESRVE
jgi:hypothetical protein